MDSAEFKITLTVSHDETMDRDKQHFAIVDIHRAQNEKDRIVHGSYARRQTLAIEKAMAKALGRLRHYESLHK